MSKILITQWSEEQNISFDFPHFLQFDYWDGKLIW